MASAIAPKVSPTLRFILQPVDAALSASMRSAGPGAQFFRSVYQGSEIHG